MNKRKLRWLLWLISSPAVVAYEYYSTHSPKSMLIGIVNYYLICLCIDILSRSIDDFFNR